MHDEATVGDRALVLGATPVAAAPSSLRWMLGRWCVDAPDGTRTCEQRIEAGGQMQGDGSTTRRGKIVEQEKLRIVTHRARSITRLRRRTLHAVPAHPLQAATRLPFVNTQHDYPQRIRYWREGDDLFAEIALADRSKAMQWHYKRQ